MSDESELAVSDLEDSSQEASDDGQNNSAEAVAVRRAFLASVMSGAHSFTGSQHDKGKWTGDHILSWLTGAMELAVAVDDRQKGAQTLWLVWVQRLDQNMIENGYLGLRSMMPPAS